MASEGKAKYARFQELRDAKGVSNYQVAKATGIAQQTLSSWSKGEYTPKNDKIRKLAEYFGVDVSYFEGSDPIYDAYRERVRRERTMYEAAAGQGRINDGLPMEESVEAEREDFGFVKIVGDSMYPDLQDGDVLKTIPYDGEDISPNDYCVVKVDGEALTVKHIEMTENGVWLRAVNKAVFEDVFYSTKEVMTIPILIVGKAISIAYREL